MYGSDNPGVLEAKEECRLGLACWIIPLRWWTVIDGQAAI